MRLPPLPKDDRARSSTADTDVGTLEIGADAQRVRDRSRSPTRLIQDVRAEWMTLQERQEARQASFQERQEAIQSSLFQSMQGLARSLSTQQQQQQQLIDSLVAYGPLSG